MGRTTYRQATGSELVRKAQHDRLNSGCTSAGQGRLTDGIDENPQHEPGRGIWCRCCGESL